MSRTRRLLLASLVLILLSGTGSSGASQPRPKADSLIQTVRNCAHLDGDLFEVCFAYAWNDQHFALQPYYKWAKAANPVERAYAKCRLGVPEFYCRSRDARYVGSALKKIVARVNGWKWKDGTTNTVEGPRIAITAAVSSLACNKGVLQTREDWLVLSEDRRQLYQESGKVHTVILRRIPDVRFRLDIDYQDIHIHKVLHKWVVSELYDAKKNVKPTC